MILVTGGVASGKRTYLRSLGYGDSDSAVLLDAQELVRESGADVEAIADEIARSKQAVAIVEVGSGIVPANSEERAWRDRAGNLARALAAHADVVVRMVCGIPSFATKPRASLQKGRAELVIMRHGQTEANAQRRYTGKRDMPLNAQGEREARAAGVVRGVSRVYTSGFSRAQATARICFPDAEQVEEDGLAELDFGIFEGRSADEMKGDTDYRAWVEGGCIDRCPEGECRADLIARVTAAVERIVYAAFQEGNGGVYRTGDADGAGKASDINQADHAGRAVIVAHGGTIMAAMSAFADPDADFFSWKVGNCEGYRVEVAIEKEKVRFISWDRFHDLSFMTPSASETNGAESSSPPQQPFPPHSFFTNRACEYFPCHEGIDPHEFNCLFCYCPLYALGPACGGNFTYTERGRKNCTNCAIPHIRDNGVHLVAARYEELATRAAS